MSEHCYLAFPHLRVLDPNTLRVVALRVRCPSGVTHDDFQRIRDAASRAVEHLRANGLAPRTRSSE
jgi:hypothetical protein